MKRVAVLKGGWSAEREVSLTSGAAVERALQETGYDVLSIDLDRDLRTLFDALDPKPDVIFNALHGRWGEDGCIQGVLEVLGIPYTHSGVRASAIAMDKEAAKQAFRAAGLNCPPGIVAPCDAVHGVMEEPYVVKPLREGSSIGVLIVQGGHNRAPLDEESWTYGQEALVERYIPGRELTVAVMGDRALGVTEIRPYQGFYNYETKYTEGRAEHLVPAPVPPRIYDEACETALVAHRALGCRGVTRCDFRYDDTEADPGILYLLELNTQPGMTPLSLVPEQAAYAGISFPALVQWIVEDARCDA